MKKWFILRKICLLKGGESFANFCSERASSTKEQSSTAISPRRNGFQPFFLNHQRDVSKRQDIQDLTKRIIKYGVVTG